MPKALFYFLRCFVIETASALWKVERAQPGANHFNSANAAKTSAMEKNSPSSLSKKKMRSRPSEEVTKKPHVEWIGKKTMKVKKKLKPKTSRRA